MRFLAVAFALLALDDNIFVRGYCNLCSDRGVQGLYSNMPGRDSLWRGQDLFSRLKAYRATMQWDSNFVLYNGQNGVKWAANSQGTGATRVVIQGDGNVVAVKDDGTPAWASQTAGQGKGPYCLMVRDNLVWGNGLKVFDDNCDWFWWSGRSIAGGANDTGIIHGTAKTANAVDAIFDRLTQDPAAIGVIYEDIVKDNAVRSVFERIVATSTDESTDVVTQEVGAFSSEAFEHWYVRFSASRSD
ncbi:Aste57867_523 [Aphanomyces stellatus]|uniref:Aste57867_523 protein n=1 Tax=Aphanomyces stellatus TaxID=120398 RepID=A0A485K3U2_9STRA|nr:hypothetical protein As57867_000522 [Aphanomyces stellatus]VFT77748.1 Aste57867_523 [Aphanomyces stellatus]